jgi:recombination protein RecR
MHYPSHLQKVINVLKRLPGVGTKSAERYAFHMLDWPQEYLYEMAQAFKDIPEKIKTCDECGCLRDEQICPFCTEQRKNSGLICILSSPKEAFSIESTGEYKGLYHVLGGLLSPLDGVGPDKLSIHSLKKRIADLKIQEIVIALDSTLEGDATALYLKQELESFHVVIYRLAFGLPMGSPIDYVDGGTLARAFSARSKF